MSYLIGVGLLIECHDCEPATPSPYVTEDLSTIQTHTAVATYLDMAVFELTVDNKMSFHTTQYSNAPQKLLSVMRGHGTMIVTTVGKQRLTLETAGYHEFWEIIERGEGIMRK